MKVYVYCSYKFSPVGFQIGVIDTGEKSGEYYIPAGGALDDFVVKAFEQGFIRKVYAAERCAEFVVPDRTVETFALKIDAEKFDAFIAEMLGNSAEPRDSDKLFVEVISSQPQEDKLRKTFGLDFSREGDSKIYRSPAEKKLAPSEDSSAKKNSKWDNKWGLS